MADIISGKSRFLSSNKDKRVYRIDGDEPEDEEKDQDEENYYKKIRRHKRRKIVTGLLGIALVVVIVIAIVKEVTSYLFNVFWDC